MKSCGFLQKLCLSLFLFSASCFASSVAQDNNQFTFALYSKLTDQQDNIAFSPYSIFTSLSLLYFGAQADTAKQIKSALHLSADDAKFLKAFHHHLEGLTRPLKGGYQLTIANGLFPHKGTHFMTQFKTLATEVFDAKLQSVDYDVLDVTLKTINDWVDRKTGGKISHLVSESDVNAATRLIVANAVYFEGHWVHPFSSQQTVTAPFHLESGQPVDVDMLTQTAAFAYYENDSVQCLALPFIRKSTHQPFLECFLVLPKESLSHLEAQLSYQNLEKWIMEAETTAVDVKIPKFCFSKKLLLNTPLKDLGIDDAFGFQADFEKIDGMKDLYLNKVLHETFFSFHEEGVTAASATSSHLGIKALPPISQTPKSFTADRPFLFFIVDTHSKTILFMGRVANPNKDQCDEN